MPDQTILTPYRTRYCCPRRPPFSPAKRFPSPNSAVAAAKTANLILSCANTNLLPMNIARTPSFWRLARQASEIKSRILQQQYHKYPKQSTYEEFKMVANRCAQAAALLASKATQQDADQYKAIVLQTCQRVATAIAEQNTMGADKVRWTPKKSLP